MTYYEYVVPHVFYFSLTLKGFPVFANGLPFSKIDSPVCDPPFKESLINIQNVVLIVQSRFIVRVKAFQCVHSVFFESA